MLTIFVPLATSLQIILVAKATRDDRTAGEVFRDVLPFHPSTSKLDDEGIFFGDHLDCFLADVSAELGGWPRVAAPGDGEVSGMEAQTLGSKHSITSTSTTNILQVGSAVPEGYVFTKWLVESLYAGIELASRDRETSR